MASMLWDALDTNNFYFILFFWFYSNFVFVFVLDDEKACDTTVTWQVT